MYGHYGNSNSNSSNNNNHYYGHYGHYGYDHGDEEDADDYADYDYGQNSVESDDWQPEIVLAARRGDLGEIKYLVDMARDDRERRRLVNRAGHWKEDLERNPSTTTRGQNGTTTTNQQPLEWYDETPLLAAVAADCSETVEYLLRQGADPTLEAQPDYLYPVTADSIIKRRINFRTNDKPELYLQNHDPSFVLDATYSTMEAAQRIFKRAHGHLRCAVLLGTAMKFWNKAEYSSSQYNHARERSGYTNRPTDKDGLLKALDRIPPIPTPTKEILQTLMAQVTALRQASVVDEDATDDEDSLDDAAAHALSHSKRSQQLVVLSKKGKESPKKKKTANNGNSNNNNNNSKKYKAAMSTYGPRCRFFAKGHCRNGDKCHFRHES